jgi:hypothetical protein
LRGGLSTAFHLFELTVERDTAVIEKNKLGFSRRVLVPLKA